MTRSQLMKKAWHFARGIAKEVGVGKASDYIAVGMKRAWVLYGKQIKTAKKTQMTATGSSMTFARTSANIKQAV